MGRIPVHSVLHTPDDGTFGAKSTGFVEQFDPVQSVGKLNPGSSFLVLYIRLGVTCLRSTKYLVDMWFRTTAE